jgi:hypothetical protein
MQNRAQLVLGTCLLWLSFISVLKNVFHSCGFCNFFLTEIQFSFSFPDACPGNKMAHV